jgi:hypothetical protein
MLPAHSGIMEYDLHCHCSDYDKDAFQLRMCTEELSTRTTGQVTTLLGP